MCKKAIYTLWLVIYCFFMKQSYEFLRLLVHAKAEGRMEGKVGPHYLL